MRAISLTLLLLAAVACTTAEDMPEDIAANNADEMEGSLMERLTKLMGDLDELSQKYRRYKGYHPSFRGALNGVRYLVFKYERTYDEAKEVCQGYGGTLADIKSEAIHNFVEGLVRKVDPHKSYWIGLNDMATEGTWAWSRGETVSDCGYTNWAPGQPDNFLWSQDCGRMWDWANFKWDDANCADKYHFVCQIGRRMTNRC
ncbi:PREDICTED: C-type lectin lectoxin-Lio2-like [Branchiostoma belcheri]|uniref:C-type lectin lectoxin-Lio2-like n=1 Tax=Branchiostoma belcheri TaxID=7741 RepID=A0A6P5ANW4_BRABE|nr:PREDICTED: C-type lectin lectoxin-Lio2-like [Branchiostoma belcheri]